MKQISFTLTYRAIVFALVVFYLVNTVVTAEYTQFAGPFRYLTHWALVMALIAALYVLRHTKTAQTNLGDVYISAASVVNLMVVFLFWRLYFNDPNSVTSDGELSVWWREYYLHALGPALLIFDAVCINRIFRHYARSLGVLVAIIVLYVLWIEFILAPINDDPVGKLHDGYPYPFLNDRAWQGRAIFYTMNMGVAALFLAVLAGLSAFVRRFV